MRFATLVLSGSALPDAGKTTLPAVRGGVFYSFEPLDGGLVYTCLSTTSIDPSRKKTSVSQASRWLPISMPGEPTGMPGTVEPSASAAAGR